MKIKKVYTINEVDQTFARFEYMAKQRTVLDSEIRNEMIDFFESAGYVRTVYKLSPDLLFRSRKFEVETVAEAEGDLSRARHISYPHTDVLHYIGQGRCNNAREAVFYASNENGVPFLEVRPKLGDFAGLALFRNQVQAPITIQAPIVGVKQLIESFKKNAFGAGWVRMLEKDWLFTTDQKQLVRIDDLVAEWFMQPVDGTNKYYYRLTTIIYKIYTEHIAHDGVYADGLIYPSVAAEAKGANFALKTSFVDANMEFLGTSLYHFEEEDGDHKHLRRIRAAVADDIVEEDNLVWKDVTTGEDPFILGLDLNPKEFPPIYPPPAPL